MADELRFKRWSPEKYKLLEAVVLGASIVLALGEAQRIFFLWMDPTQVASLREFAAQGSMLLAVIAMGAMGAGIMRTGKQPSPALVAAFLILFWVGVLV